MNNLDKTKLYRPVVRVRDNNNYTFDREEFIASIEDKFSVDITTIPNWQQLIKRLEVSSTNYKIKLQEAQQRKRCIIEKLHNEYNRRPDPSHAVEKLKKPLKKLSPELHSSNMQAETVTRMATAHMNSLAGSTAADENEYQPQTPEDQTVAQDKTALKTEKSHNFSTKSNDKTIKRLIISPASSMPKVLSFAQQIEYPLPTKTLSSKTSRSENRPGKVNMTKQKPLIHFLPPSVIINNDSFDVQTLKFSIVNIVTQIIFLRFINITDKTCFKRAKVEPPIAIQLPPGLSCNFKLIFQLEKNKDDFESSILFEVGYYRSFQSYKFSYQIPIYGKLLIQRSILVSKQIDFGSKYYWQHELEYSYHSTKNVKVRLQSNFPYHLHIERIYVDYLAEYKKTTAYDEESSVPSKLHEETNVSHHSLLEKKDINKKSLKIGPPPTKSSPDKKKAKHKNNESMIGVDIVDVQHNVEHLTNRNNVIQNILKTLVQRVMDAFLFDFEYVCVEPNTISKIPVSFRFYECLGPHQFFYDFKFYDTVTGELAAKKTVNLFADVIGHPLKITPPILDMRHSIMSFGLYRDKFVITNMHKRYPMLITVHIDSIVGKLIHIDPVSVSIPQNSSVDIYLSHCSSESFADTTKSALYFVLRITCTGDKGYCFDAPDVFYEIIAPFTFEYSTLVKKENIELTEDEGVLIQDIEQEIKQKEIPHSIKENLQEDSLDF